MSCDECEKCNEGQKGIAYYRWGTANIGLIGCQKHLKEVIDALNQAQKKGKCRYGKLNKNGEPDYSCDCDECRVKVIEDD